MTFEGRDDVWKIIYGYENCSMDEWEEICGEFLDNYVNMQEENYRTIEDCVKEDMEKETYFGFVHFFLEKTSRNKKKYKELFQSYVQEFQKNHPGWCFNEIGQILPDLDFQNPEISLGEEDEWKNFIKKPAELKSWDSELNENKNIKIGELAPARKYELVQCALVLGLTAKLTNELLSYGEMEGLYPVNIIDSICIFYLDYFAQYNGYDNYSKEELNGLLEKQRENLKELKSQVNNYLKKYLNAVEDEMTKLEDEKNGAKFKGFAFTDSLDKLISQKLDWVRNRISELENKEFVASLIRKDDTRPSVTIFFENLQSRIWEKNNAEEQLREFKEAFMSDEHLRMFTLHYYSYQEKILKFAKKREQYRKNTYMSAEKLNAKTGSGRRLEEPEWYINAKYVNEFENCKNITQILSDIWQIDCLRYSGAVNSNTRSAINHLLLGRRVPHSRLEEDEQEEKDVRYYEAVLGKRSTIIKYVLATGNEDYLDYILEAAGLHGISTENPGFVDALVGYAFCYRDALLSKWAEDMHGVDSKVIMQEMKRKFPMVKLILEISRDIQFILEYKTGLYEAEKKFMENLRAFPKPVFNEIWTKLYESQTEKIIENPEILTSIFTYKNKNGKTRIEAPSLLFPLEIRQNRQICEYKDNLQQNARYVLKELFADMKKSAKRGHLLDVRSEEYRKNIIIENAVLLDLSEKTETLDMQLSKTLKSKQRIYILINNDEEAQEIMKYFNKKLFEADVLNQNKIVIVKMTEEAEKKIFDEGES